MVFPIILGSGTPKPTPTTNKHTCTTKKNTQKGPPPPDLTASLPAVSFFASAQLAPSTQSQHQSRSMSSLLLWLCLNFNRADRLPFARGFLSFRLSRLGNPLPTAERFRHSSGRGMRGDSTPDTGRSMAGSTEGGVKFFTESTAAKLKGSRICV